MDGDLRRWTRVDVLPADGMQEAWGSNPHSSTGFPDLCSNQSDCPSDYGARLTGAVFACAEHGVHDGRAALDRGDDDLAVDGLGDVGGLVAHGVADLLDGDAVAAHDGHGGV